MTLAGLFSNKPHPIPPNTSFSAARQIERRSLVKGCNGKTEELDSWISKMPLFFHHFYLGSLMDSWIVG